MSGGELFWGIMILGAVSSIVRWRIDVAWREGHDRGLLSGYLDGRRAERAEQERIREEARA